MELILLKVEGKTGVIVPWDKMAGHTLMKGVLWEHCMHETHALQYCKSVFDIL